MATIPNLIAVGNARNLEAWWYPVWDKALQVYVAPGYPVGGGTANLAVGPQSSLSSPPGGWPYLYPDFTVFETPRAGALAGTKTLRMVMENKRGATQGQAIAAQLQVQNQMARATIPANDPPVVVGQSIWGIATYAQFWCWYRMILGGAGWGPIALGGGFFNIALLPLTPTVVV